MKPTYEELEARCAALAAENTGLNSVIEAVRGVANESIGIAGWHKNGEIATWEEILPEIDDIETPATDAFLAEVRAQGVEMLRDSIAEVGGSIEDTIDLYHYCSDFAAQLRKGVQS